MTGPAVTGPALPLHGQPNTPCGQPITLRGLYGMADADFGEPVALGEMLLEAGACVIQLRAKTWSEERVAQALRQLHPLCKAAGVPLIVNDRAALAHLADGLHLGQDDGPFPANCGLKGRSTHDVLQLHAAMQEGADYVGFGPMYTTETKAEAGPGRGLLPLAQVLQQSQIPVVAIGGITLARLPELRRSGVRSWAVISAILSAPDPLAAARAFGA
ncbi:MAG: thiamine-phosphate pyrophosphorylase [Cognaticolwellia sp.]